MKSRFKCVYPILRDKARDIIVFGRDAAGTQVDTGHMDTDPLSSELQ
jgi:hypothetical protein